MDWYNRTMSDYEDELGMVSQLGTPRSHGTPDSFSNSDNTPVNSELQNNLIIDCGLQH